jgi:hypothetical protein
MSYHFRPILNPFFHRWYDIVVLFGFQSYRKSVTGPIHYTDREQRDKMGTIIGRTRKDGSKTFIAQIVIKKGGATVHREAETFDRKQAANA